MFRKQYPELSHVENYLGANYFVTIDSRVGAIFEIKPLDSEVDPLKDGYNSLLRIIRGLSSNVILRVISRTGFLQKEDIDHSRKEAISHKGALAHQLYVIIERSVAVNPMVLLVRGLTSGFRNNNPLSNELLQLHEGIDRAELAYWNSRNLTEHEIKSFFRPFNHEAVQTAIGIDGGDEHMGVIRFWKPGVSKLSTETLAILRELIPAPYEIVTNIRKIPATQAHYILKKKSAQHEQSTQSTSLRQLEMTESILEETFLEGASLVQVEWLLILKRNSEGLLKDSIGAATRALSGLGDIYHETYGAHNSYVSSLPGSDPHHMFLERDYVALHFCPVAIRGESRPDPQYIAKRALALHRQDGSLCYFDLFNPKYLCFNAVINGKPGSGKSVFGNILTTALLNDPQISMIKVDVGGSYRKECELYGGQQIDFTLDKPSGLNPFEILAQTEHSNDITSILSDYIATLVLEADERMISKEILSTIERAVGRYSQGRPKKPTFDDFLKCSSDLPRSALLKRWAEGGVFSNILRPLEGRNGELPRYRYFNFESIHNAANQDFAQGCMAAVIANYNAEVVRIGDARSASKRRLVFFGDETPFFIQRNGRFFKLTAANARKFGHALILIAQTTEHLVLVGEDGRPDTSILKNSPNRFFFQVDGETSEFKQRFDLSEVDVDRIKNLIRNTEFREVLLQDEFGTRVVRLAVTNEEYWRATSSRSDNEKLYGLMKEHKGLKLEEAIRWLSHSKALN